MAAIGTIVMKRPPLPPASAVSRVETGLDRLLAAPSPDTTDRFFGWHAVTAAFVVAVFGWGLGFYGPPVYLEVVRQSRGWPIALISGAVTLHFAIGLALIPNLPALYRRFGLPIVTVLAGVAMAIGVLGWALADQPWQLYAAAVLTGIGWSALGAVAVNAIVVPWFSAKRALALGVAFNGGSVGGVIFSPLWIALITWLGFVTAAIVVGAAMVAILGVLAVLVLRKTPKMLGQTPDGLPLPSPVATILSSGGEAPSTGRELAHNRAFLTLCLGMTLALFAQTGLVAHLVSVLSPTLGTQNAGLTVGACGIAAVVGRLAVGSRASAIANWRLIAALSLMAQAAGCGILMLAAGTSPLLLVLGVVMFGLGVGNAISIPPVIAGVEFKEADASRVVALIVAISQGAYAAAPAAFGILRQLGSDNMMFLVAIAAQIAGIAAYLMGRGVKVLDAPVS